MFFKTVHGYVVKKSPTQVVYLHPFISLLWLTYSLLSISCCLCDLIDYDRISAVVNVTYTLMIVYQLLLMCLTRFWLAISCYYGDLLVYDCLSAVHILTYSLMIIYELFCRHRACSLQCVTSFYLVFADGHQTCPHQLILAICHNQMEKSIIYR